MVEKHREVIEEIEEFIERYNNLDYTIKPKADKMVFTSDGTTLSLADWLSHSVTDYTIHKDDLGRVSYAIKCLVWKNRAVAYNLIVEGKGLMSKIKECNEKNAKLEEDNKLLRRRLDQCEKRRRELEEEAKKLFRGKSFTGDVQQS